MINLNNYIKLYYHYLIQFEFIIALFCVLDLEWHSKGGDWGLGIGDWGLGIGDWGLAPIPNPQSPIPNPQNR